MAKKKRKFNVVDAVIILIVLAVIAVAVLLLTQRSGSVEEVLTEIEYNVELRTIRDEFADNFAAGVQLIDSAAKYRLGEIVAVSVEAATFTGTNLVTGELVYSDYPEHSDVTLTVRAKASVDENGLYVLDGGYKLSVGRTIYVRTPDYVGAGYCTKLSETEVG